MNWYEIKAQNDSAEILIYDEIGAWGKSAKDFADDIKALKNVNHLNIRINSPGGSVADGNAIFNTIKNHKARTVIDIDGVALSMASVVAMAGDVVRMAQNAMFMIHNPWGAAIGNSDEMRKQADVMDKMKTSLVNTYVAKTGLSQQEISNMMDEETWLNADEALDKGFIDEITNALDVAASFDLSKFKNVPDSLKKIKINMKSDNDQSLTDQIVKEVAAAINEGYTFTPLYSSDRDKPSAVADTNEGEKMNANNSTDTVESNQTVDNAVKAALQAEATRQSEIRDLFKLHGDSYRELQDRCLEDQAIDVNDAGKMLLKEIGKNREPLSGGTELINDEKDKAREGMANALLMRTGLETRDQSNEFQSYTLLDMARHCLKNSNFSGRGKSKMEIVGAAFTHSSSDFPYLLEDTINKSLQAAYGNFPETWPRIADVGSVPDFKVNSRIRLGSFNSLDVVPEGEEYTHGTFSEEKETLQAQTKGKLISITRQAIINDDLAGFNRIAAELGRAAQRTIGNDVYSVINTNGNMADGNPLFDATHSNLAGTGAAPTTTTVGAGRAAMRKQTDLSGLDYLDIRPAIFLVPVALEDTANVLTASETDPNQSNSRKPNPIRGFAEVVSDPRLDATSTTAWYLLAAPGLAPTIEVAFLDGNQTPYLESQNGFTIDGVIWKVRLDYAVDAVDWRGAYKNAGA